MLTFGLLPSVFIHVIEHEVSEEEKSGDEDDFVPSDSDDMTLGKGKRKKSSGKKSKPESNPR